MRCNTLHVHSDYITTVDDLCSYIQKSCWIYTEGKAEISSGGTRMCVLLKMNTEKWCVKVSMLLTAWRCYALCPFCIETGGLFRLAVDLMQLFSDNKRYVCIPFVCVRECIIALLNVRVIILFCL